jgi:hypothetical protein
MNNYSVKKYDPNYYERWNRFVDNSNNGSIYHRQAFLNYHKSRFADMEHHLMFFKGETMVCILPLSISEIDNVLTAQSPVGASWGGFVYGNLDTKNCCLIVELFLNYLRGLKVQRVRIVSVPHYCYIDQTFPMEFAMINLGFKKANIDLLHLADLSEVKSDVFEIFTSKSRNQTRKGMEKFKKLSTNKNIPRSYDILVENKKQLNSSPTHTIEEITDLMEKFPHSIYFENVEDGGSLAGSTIIETNSFSKSTFYLYQNASAKGSNALNALIYYSMRDAYEKGFKYFDFGLSSMHSKISNMGLVDFKESFGAQVHSRETLIINL